MWLHWVVSVALVTALDSVAAQMLPSDGKKWVPFGPRLGQE
jgi:hypothetical protein